MWEIPFDIAMLERGNVIIRCLTEEMADELFRVLLDNGVRWYGNETMGETHWTARREDTGYRITSQRTMKYGSVEHYSEDSEYDDCIKCTFYGTDTPDFEVASDKELQDVLGIGGI